jgi:hypothetical protein
MRRRLLQAIGGAKHGGAEISFVRLARALHRIGETQRVLIRHDAGRTRQLRAAGVAVRELGFGGWLDLPTQLGFWACDIRLATRHRADPDELRDRRLPAG